MIAYNHDDVLRSVHFNIGKEYRNGDSYIKLTKADSFQLSYIKERSVFSFNIYIEAMGPDVNFNKGIGAWVIILFNSGYI
jgi:hypothetical protein